MKMWEGMWPDESEERGIFILKQKEHANMSFPKASRKEYSFAGTLIFDL
jgi:hypothetical protein